MMRHEIIGTSGIQFVLPSEMDLSNCLVFIDGLLQPEYTYMLFREARNNIPGDCIIKTRQKSLILCSTITDANIIVIAL